MVNKGTKAGMQDWLADRDIRAGEDNQDNNMSIISMDNFTL